MSVFEKMCGKIGPGMCKLSMNGNIAIKTSNGYKTYNVKTGKLTNCSNFAFTFDGMDMFFMIPTNHVKKGDIIFANGLPKCVIEVNKDKSIKVLDYENSRLEDIIPERHILMDKTYFYGKIISIFGDNLKSVTASNNIMKFMMLSSMMGGKGSTTDFNSMLPMMMFMGGENNLFSGLFDSIDLSGDEDTVDDTEEEEET
jgi:hypothetical protein